LHLFNVHGAMQLTAAMIATYIAPCFARYNAVWRPAIELHRTAL